MRYTRPVRELVDDEVEGALSREIQGLTSISVQMGRKLAAVEKDLARLEARVLSLFSCFFCCFGGTFRPHFLPPAPPSRPPPAPLFCCFSAPCFAALKARQRRRRPAPRSLPLAPQLPPSRPTTTNKHTNNR